MMTCPREPNPGDKITASWMRELVRFVRSLTPIDGHGMRTSQGPNGTVYAANIQSIQKSTHLPGCFEIRLETKDKPGGFDNPYYMVGTKLYKYEEGEYYSMPTQAGILVLSVSLTGSEPNPSYDFKNSYSEVQQMTEDGNASVFPLYEFGEKGTLKADLRNVPTIQAREWMS